MSEEYEDGDQLADKAIAVYEMTKIADFLDDEDVRWTVVTVTKMIANPRIPSKTAVDLLLKLQALSFKFQEQGKYYMFIGKGETNASIKKNYYLSLSKEVADLVAVLKIIVKTY